MKLLSNINKAIFMNIVFLIMTIQLVYSQEQERSGVIELENIKISVQIPEGWILDDETLSHKGINGLFYEKGNVYEHDTPMIYIHPKRLNDGKDEELFKLVDKQIKAYTDYGGYKIERINLTFRNYNNIYFAYNFDIVEFLYQTFISIRYSDLCIQFVLGAKTDQRRNELFTQFYEIFDSMKVLE